MTDSQVTCSCARGPEGFTYDFDLGLWVHAGCGRPTDRYLTGMYESATREMSQ
jgi:hypothetical protein